MKKIFCLIAVIIIALSTTACSKGNDSSEITSETTQHTHEHTEITSQEAIMLLYNHYGNYNYDSKENYSFSIVDSVIFNDIKYYHGRWSVLEYNKENTIRGSKLKTEFFLAADGTHLYTGTYDYKTSKIEINSEKIELKH